MHPQLRGPETIARPLLPLPVQVLRQASALQNGVEPDDVSFPKTPALRPSTPSNPLRLSRTFSREPKRRSAKRRARWSFLRSDVAPAKKSFDKYIAETTKECHHYAYRDRLPRHHGVLHDALHRHHHHLWHHHNRSHEPEHQHDHSIMESWSWHQHQHHYGHHIIATPRSRILTCRAAIQGPKAPAYLRLSVGLPRYLGVQNFTRFTRNFEGPDSCRQAAEEVLYGFESQLEFSRLAPRAEAMKAV